MGAQLDTGGGKGKKKGAPPSINITPLVDIVLVLLIIFMVMTPLMMKHFSFNLPEKEDKDEKSAQAPGASNAPTALVLSIADDGKMTLNGTPMADLEALKAKLAQAFAARQDNSMFFDAADKVHYGQVAEALDASREAGAKAIAFVTDRSKLAQLR